jgi:hypothetical protein
MQNNFALVKSEIPARKVLEHLLGPPDKSGKWLCAFHEEKTPSLSERNGGIVCFGCGWRGDIIRFLQEQQGCGPNEALAYLADRWGLTLSELQPVGYKVPEIVLIMSNIRKESRRIVLGGPRTAPDWRQGVANLLERTADDCHRLAGKLRDENEMVWDFIDCSAQCLRGAQTLREYCLQREDVMEAASLEL